MSWFSRDDDGYGGTPFESNLFVGERRRVVQNPKTTVVGYLVLAGAVIKLVTELVQGNFSAAVTDYPTVMAALAGVGLVMAKDGGH